MTEDLTIKTEEVRLLDGSYVYNVHLIDKDSKQALRFSAVSEKSALSFAEAFKQLVNAHTLVNDVRVTSSFAA